MAGTIPALNAKSPLTVVNGLFFVSVGSEFFQELPFFLLEFFLADQFFLPQLFQNSQPFCKILSTGRRSRRLVVPQVLDFFHEPVHLGIVRRVIDLLLERFLWRFC